MDYISLGLLIMRLGFAGTMAFRHGLPKLLGFTSAMHTFPDPIGWGSVVSLTAAVSAEFFCGILVLIGIFTRFAVIPLIITMAVAFFIIHSADPFMKKELALIYLVGFSAIFAAGPGRFSLDGLFRGAR